MRFDTIGPELRQTARGLLQNKLLTGGAAIALAIGIGATTTLFSIVHGGLRDLPFPRPDELVMVTRSNPAAGWTNRGAQAFDFRIWSTELRSLSGVSAFSTISVNLAGAERAPERVNGARIDAKAFALLGAEPSLGRGLRAEDVAPGAERVAVIGHSLWQARFAGDPGIVGKITRIDGEPTTIIGVMPERFGFPVNQAIWLPLPLPTAPAANEGEWLTVFGRLRQGTTIEGAQAELNTLAARLAREQPATHGDRQLIRVAPFVELEFDPNMSSILYLMLLAISFVLLIACANVANLLLANAARRSRETAVRIALGAGRGRIIAQQLLESTLIALLGGVGGIAIAYMGVRFFAAATRSILSAFWVDFRVDGTVLLFSTALIGGAALLAGLVPALRASSVPAATVLKESTAAGLRMGRFSRALVTAELALACGLLIVSGILVKSAVGLRTIDFPFEDSQIYTAQLSFPVETSAAERTRTVEQLSQELRTIPGVRAAALTSVLPGRGPGSWGFALDGRTYERVVDQPTTGVAMVTPGFFEVVGATVMRGRGIDWADAEGAPRSAVVNESWVRRYSADRAAIGRVIKLSGEEPATIVGVVPDFHMQDPGKQNSECIFLSALQYEPFTLRIMLLGRGDVLTLTPQVRAAVAKVDPDLPLFEIATLRSAIYADAGVLNAFGTLFGFFGAGALFLTMVGLYGVVSFSVTQRTREIGIRMSLGATRGRILALIVRSGGMPLAIGGLLGIALGAAISIALAATGEDVLRPDPHVFVVVVIGLGLTALTALFVPARRAAALEPQEALRSNS